MTTGTLGVGRFWLTSQARLIGSYDMPSRASDEFLLGLFRHFTRNIFEIQTLPTGKKSIRKHAKIRLIKIVTI